MFADNRYPEIPCRPKDRMKQKSTCAKHFFNLNRTVQLNIHMLCNKHPMQSITNSSICKTPPVLVCIKLLFVNFIYPRFLFEFNVVFWKKMKDAQERKSTKKSENLLLYLNLRIISNCCEARPRKRMIKSISIFIFSL